MKRSKALRFWLALAALAVACVVPLSAAPAKGGALVYGTWQSPDNLDVQVSGLQITWNIAVQVFDPLVRRMPGQLEFKPGLAEKWEVNADSTEFTFTLRKGVKFHDGTPMNAQAVKFSLDRIADPATRSAARAARWETTRRRWSSTTPRSRSGSTRPGRDS